MSILSRLVESWVERGDLPDSVIRAGIRYRLRQRLAELPMDDPEAAADWTRAFVQSMAAAPIAPIPQKPNEQHYEVPEAFFGQVLGPRRKYSCCYWGPGVSTLQQAEREALRITCERAELSDGQDVLELGCGWGSLSLWMAEYYPNSRITVFSNSSGQRRYIQAQADAQGLKNLTVLTADMNAFDTEDRFDRVVSLEMFEHMRNYQRLYQNVARWLRPGGRFFKHIFCHRSLPYLFEDKDDDDWMARHFFSGGMMPSDALPLYFQDELRLVDKWRWHGTHYVKTLEAWLELMDSRKDAIWPIFEGTYGKDTPLWWVRWRLFFLACSELFAFDHGREWWVSHYLFEKRTGE